MSGASIRIDFAPGAVDITQDAAVIWIRAAASAVAAYYGQFPVTRARVLVIPIAGRSGVLGGTTWGDAGGYPGFTTIRLGQHTNEEQLGSDWVMTHEFVHMAFPSVPDDQHWLEEGLATYIEPIARGQRGMLSEASIWNEMVRNMPKGNSQASDHGLNHTHTWASTYWGGALFCLVADVTIRKRTGNRKGLQDALRGIVAMQGTIDKDWPPSKVLAIGDDATGTSVLSDLYRAMGDTPGDIDWIRSGKSWESLPRMTPSPLTTQHRQQRSANPSHTTVPNTLSTSKSHKWPPDSNLSCTPPSC